MRMVLSLGFRMLEILQTGCRCVAWRLRLRKLECLFAQLDSYVAVQYRKHRVKWHLPRQHLAGQCQPQSHDLIVQSNFDPIHHIVKPRFRGNPSSLGQASILLMVPLIPSQLFQQNWQRHLVVEFPLTFLYLRETGLCICAGSLMDDPDVLGSRSASNRPRHLRNLLCRSGTT